MQGREGGRQVRDEGGNGFGLEGLTGSRAWSSPASTGRTSGRWGVNGPGAEELRRADDIRTIVHGAHSVHVICLLFCHVRLWSGSFAIDFLSLCSYSWSVFLIWIWIMECSMKPCLVIGLHYEPEKKSCWPCHKSLVYVLLKNNFLVWTMVSDLLYRCFCFYQKYCWILVNMAIKLICSWGIIVKQSNPNNLESVYCIVDHASW
jgi:hypothetical protein